MKKPCSKEKDTVPDTRIKTCDVARKKLIKHYNLKQVKPTTNRPTVYKFDNYDNQFDTKFKRPVTIKNMFDKG